MNPHESCVVQVAMPTNGPLPPAFARIGCRPRRFQPQIDLSPAHSRATIPAVGRMHPAQAFRNRVKHP